MKKLIFILLASCLTGTACREERPVGEQEYPRNIAFTEYSLEGTSCQWKGFGHLENTLLMINSDEEMEWYMTCIGGSYPKVDFSKYTLLLIKSISPRGIDAIEKKLRQFSADTYLLDIKVRSSGTPAFERWNVALIVPKLSNESQITLNISNDYGSGIPFKELSLYGTSCEWKENFTPYAVLINDNEKLQDYLVCADENSVPIDFSEQSLILMRGQARNGINYITLNFVRIAKNEYIANVEIHTIPTYEAPPWIKSILVPKIDDGAKISLNVSQLPY